MIIKNIKIRNYKTYLSLDLDLSVQSDRPIILIGGMNGGGKTTLFEAICGALYGLKIKDKDYFKELLNNGAVGTVKPEISLELTFEGLVLGQKKKYILKRTYILNPSDMPVESVSLNMDGTPFVYGIATPMAVRAEQEQQVNKIIKANLPQELSKYFLFDAMQSSELLKENVFAQIIKENIESVMGFNKYLQLKRAAEHVQQEWAARRLEAQQEQDEYNSLCAQKVDLETQQQVNLAEQDKCYKLIVAMQESYDAAREGVKNDAETQRKIDSLETSIAETNELATRYNSQLKSVVDTLEVNVFFPKLGESITPEVDEILRQKKALLKEQEGLLSLEQIKEVTAKIIAYMKSKVLCPQDVDADEIINYVQRSQKQFERVDNYDFLDQSELEALQDLIKANAVNEFIALDRLHKDEETRLDLLDNQTRQVNILRGSLVGGNATIIQEFEDAKNRFDILKKEYADREGVIKKLERQIHNIDVQIQQEPDIKYDTLVALKPFFTDVVNSLLRRKKEKIEEDMREQLNKLLISYKGYISRVVLSDTMQDFTIKLYHKAGNEISLNQLNAASKQIFIQVLLKVLRNLGDYNPPVMIDTVMGVLDEESRDVLMEEYFPSLADQTILLCTTSEIRKDSDYKKIESFVSRSYTLKRNIEAQNTTVEDGFLVFNSTTDMEVVLDNLTQAENIIEDIIPLKEILERKINLSRQLGLGKPIVLTWNKVMRICLIASLNLADKRSIEHLNDVQLNKSSQRIQPSFFTKDNKRSLFSALLKLRYKDCDVDWRDNRTVARIVAQEIYRGLNYLLEDNNLNSFLYAETRGGRSTDSVPALELLIGEYADNVEATLDINSRNVTNAQIIIAGATGSGKTNLLAVLIQQFRNISTDSPYPVNFLLFDYKGEFSDPANNSWLALFDVHRSCILDPVKEPLPFSPFKDFTGKPLNEINLYSTEMANALVAIDRGSLIANMSNRLSEAIIGAYKKTNGKPITFDLMLKEYQARMVNADKDDSISSILKQLVRNKLFADEDKVNLTDECFIVKMDSFPKDGPIAKAIVYFIISKLNNIYEQLPKQVVSEDYVQIRHFTIIDEAHYMLDFDNRPLRNLIAVGRNKGLSIILATQNMDQFKSKHFDFYANAQYPLIMKQQSIADGVIKDLFGVSGREFQEIKSEIAALQKGELIIKDTTLAALGISGKTYKKIKTNHLI